MKKIFRSHIILVTEGRLFCLLMIFAIGFFGYPMVLSLKENDYFLFILYLGIVCLFAACFFLAFWKFFWPLAWGKLIVDDTGVKWRCLFKKSIFLSWEECKYMGFETFTQGNVVKVDIYKTGFKYIYFSATPYPKEFSGKINKLHCKEGFIKFFPVNERLCGAVLEHVDVPVFKTYVEEQKRAKNRQQKMKQKKSKKQK